MVSMSVNGFELIGKDNNSYYVEGTNKFSRFFIKHFHRSKEREIEVPASLIGTGTSAEDRSVTSSNAAPSTDGNSTTETIPVDSGTVKIRMHRRSSKNKKLFQKLVDSIETNKTSSSQDLEIIKGKLKGIGEKLKLDKNYIDSALEALKEKSEITKPTTEGVDETKGKEEPSQDASAAATSQVTLKELKITSEESDICKNDFISEEPCIFDKNFPKNTRDSPNLIGMYIYLKVQHSVSDLDLKKLAENFESSINDIARKLGITPPKGNNLLEKMNALIEAANSSKKLNEPFSGWSKGFLSTKSQTLRDAISELLLFFTYAKEIAKSDDEWNEKIIARDAKLKTLN